MASSLKEAIENDEYMRNLDKLNVMLTGYHVYQVDIDQISDTMSKLYEQTERIIEITKKLDLSVIGDFDPSKSAEDNKNAVKNIVSILSGSDRENDSEPNGLSLDNIEIEDETKNETVDTLNLVKETNPDQWYSKKTREMAESGKTEEEIHEENNTDNLIINFEKDKQELDLLVNKKKEFWAEFKKEFGEDSLFDKAIHGDDELFTFDLKALIAEIEEEEKAEMGIKENKSGNNMAPII